MIEEAVVEVVAVALDPEPNPKRLVGLKEPFESFEEVLSLVTGGGLVAVMGFVAALEEIGMLVTFCG